MKVTLQHGLSAVLVAGLALAPLAAEAQQQETPATQQQSQTGTSSTPTSGTQGSQSGTQVNPAQGPLEPVPSSQEQNPPAATPQTQQNAPAPLPANPQPQNQTEPLGTATAPGVSTVGGGASKPAGTAIAPAKQRQYRSLLIKLGLVAGVGVAAGTVYALSHGTSSLPPGSGR